MVRRVALSGLVGAATFVFVFLTFHYVHLPSLLPRHTDRGFTLGSLGWIDGVLLGTVNASVIFAIISVLKKPANANG